MVCIQCRSETQVFNSRHQRRLNSVWRRRRCLNCGTIFSTQETADYGALWRVRDSNGKLLPFSRDKLFLSLLGSLGHRKQAVADAGALTNTVTSKLAAPKSDGVIPVQQIISGAQVVLNRFDKVASVHYQAMHRR